MWVFFDMGSTLVDETIAYDHRIRDMIAGTGLTFAEVHGKRVELAQQGLDGNSAVIPYFGLKKTPWHSEDELLYPEVPVVLAGLKKRGYGLGIIANQPMGAEKRLEKWKIREYFSVIAASAELGVAKPDPKIFCRALAMADCPASRAVMIGDRLDNDIHPAKQCGMKTIWLRKGLAACQPKELGAGCVDGIADDLHDIPNIIQEILKL